MVHSPWIIIGEFNVVCFVDDHLSKQHPTPQSMDDFNSLVAYDEIFEMAYKGMWYTWENRQLGDDLVLSKIDWDFSND